MQAMSTQNLSNQRAAVTAILAVAITVGAAVGAFAGTTVALKAAPLGISQSVGDQRQGEITIGLAPTSADPIRLGRLSELNVGRAPAPADPIRLGRLSDITAVGTSVSPDALAGSPPFEPRYLAPRGK